MEEFVKQQEILGTVIGRKEYIVQSDLDSNSSFTICYVITFLCDLFLRNVASPTVSFLLCENRVVLTSGLIIKMEQEKTENSLGPSGCVAFLSLLMASSSLHFLGSQRVGAAPPAQFPTGLDSLLSLPQPLTATIVKTQY